MMKKPLAFRVNIRVSKHFSGWGVVPEWRMGARFIADFWRGAQALLHNTVRGLSLDCVRQRIVGKVWALAQTNWKRVGDSSYDPVLVLQQQEAMRERLSVNPQGLIGCKASAQSLVMVNA